MGWLFGDKKTKAPSLEEVAYNTVGFFTIFDWVTPLIGIAETVYNDPTPLQSNSWTFFVPYNKSLDSGWNENDIRSLLKERGIQSWSSQITNGELFFTVDINKAQYAEYILLERGIPINERFIGAPAPKRKGKGWFR